MIGCRWRRRLEDHLAFSSRGRRERGRRRRDRGVCPGLRVVVGREIGRNRCRRSRSIGGHLIRDRDPSRPVPHFRGVCPVGGVNPEVLAQLFRCGGGCGREDDLALGGNRRGQRCAGRSDRGIRGSLRVIVRSEVGRECAQGPSRAGQRRVVAVDLSGNGRVGRGFGVVVCRQVGRDIVDRGFKRRAVGRDGRALFGHDIGQAVDRGHGLAKLGVELGFDDLGRVDGVGDVFHLEKTHPDLPVGGASFVLHQIEEGLVGRARGHKLDRLIVHPRANGITLGLELGEVGREDAGEDRARAGGCRQCRGRHLGRRVLCHSGASKGGDAKADLGSARGAIAYGAHPRPNPVDPVRGKLHRSRLADHHSRPCRQFRTRAQHRVIGLEPRRRQRGLGTEHRRARLRGPSRGRILRHRDAQRSNLIGHPGPDRIQPFDQGVIIEACQHQIDIGLHRGQVLVDGLDRLRLIGQHRVEDVFIG